MAPSAVDQLKNRIKKHKKNLEQFKNAKEKKCQSSEAIAEHLKLVQQALDIMEKENRGSQGGAVQRKNPIDVRVLTSTFDNMRM